MIEIMANRSKIRKPVSSKYQPTMRFCVLAYAPNPLNDEKVNIGVVIEGEGFAEVRFVSNWTRIKGIDPHANIGFLKSIADEIRVNLQLESEREAMLRLMHDSWSNTIIVSDWKTCSGTDATVEMEALVSQYL